MPNDRRIKRLERVALMRASEFVLYELADPRIGLVTLTRIKLSPDLSHATLFWSVLGTDADRTKTGHALDQARGAVQRAIAEVFHTRRSPRISFTFDKSIEGAMRVTKIISDLNEERGETEGDNAPSDEDGAPAEAPEPETDTPAE